MKKLYLLVCYFDRSLYPIEIYDTKEKADKAGKQYISHESDNKVFYDSYIILEFEEKESMYPFDDFDDAFYDLYGKESLSELLLQYVRKNIDEFQYRINK